MPVFSRKPIFGYPMMVAATVLIGFISAAVWAHHRLTVGMNSYQVTFFAMASLAIAVPTGIKIFNWLATMFWGKIRLELPMLFCIAFLFQFLIAGLTGVMLGVAPFDWQLNDSYFVIAHFHYVQAWNTFVHYANFHFPPEPDGFYGYNALQQLAYFATIFIMAPLSILTGMAMSPALVNHWPAYAKLFGGRQAARSIHFLMLVGFVGFIVVHVALVALTGFARNMNHIVLGTDDLRLRGMILGFIGIALVLLSWVAAHYISWYFPRGLQHATKGGDPAGQTRHAGPPYSTRALHERPNIPTLLAQRENARAQQVLIFPL